MMKTCYILAMLAAAGAVVTCCGEIPLHSPQAAAPAASSSPLSFANGALLRFRHKLPFEENVGDAWFYIRLRGQYECYGYDGAPTASAPFPTEAELAKHDEWDDQGVRAWVKRDVQYSAQGDSATLDISGGEGQWFFSYSRADAKPGKLTLLRKVKEGVYEATFEGDYDYQMSGGRADPPYELHVKGPIPVMIYTK